MFAPLRDLEQFRKVTADPELETIVWPNGADLDPDVLHGDQPAAEPGSPAAAAGWWPTPIPLHPVHRRQALLVSPRALSGTTIWRR